MRSNKVLIVLALILASSLTSAENNPATDPKAIHALCSAANAILASQSEGDMLDQIIEYEARRHASAARRLGATDKDLEKFVRAMAQQYNSGQMTWSDIADLAEGCADFGSR